MPDGAEPPVRVRVRVPDDGVEARALGAELDGGLEGPRGHVALAGGLLATQAAVGVDAGGAEAPAGLEGALALELEKRG